MLKKIILGALLTALMAFGTYLSIPMVPVPIVLTTLFVVLAGVLIGLEAGLSSVLLYIVLGLIGLPVFSGGQSGPGVIAGPTGGYIIGYIFAVIAAGLIYRKNKNNFTLILALAVSTIVIYIPGVIWLGIKTNYSGMELLKKGMLLFLIGDAIKAIAAFFIVKGLKPLLESKKQTDE